MSVLVDSFVHEITACSPGLSAAHQATIDYWALDNPPAIVALSELGHRIVEDFNSVDRATHRHLEQSSAVVRQTICVARHCLGVTVLKVSRRITPSGNRQDIATMMEAI